MRGLSIVRQRAPRELGPGEALHPQTLITYEYCGRALRSAHGAPARLHSPVKLGYKDVKYLTGVAFLPERNGGYWSDRGYEWYAGT